LGCLCNHPDPPVIIGYHLSDPSKQAPRCFRPQPCLDFARSCRWGHQNPVFWRRARPPFSVVSFVGAETPAEANHFGPFINHVSDNARQRKTLWAYNEQSGSCGPAPGCDLIDSRRGSGGSITFLQATLILFEPVPENRSSESCPGSTRGAESGSAETPCAGSRICRDTGSSGFLSIVENTF